jgi:XTP/dITP diphosphohydrolase
MNLLIATRNPGKLKEIRAIFDLPFVKLLSLDDVGEMPEVIEDRNTFEANAVKKAVTLALASGMWTLADDSGLEVDALDGAPGVYSARYAGEPADHAANNRKLLAELTGKPDRAARFRCVIALANPRGRSQFVEGACEGTIAEALCGDHGFGYDPLFIPKGYDKTFGELDADVKNRISHRAVALAKAIDTWIDLLTDPPPSDF